MTVMKLQHVLLQLGKIKPLLFQKYPIANLGIFGSVSRGEEGPESDLDILVEFSRPVGIEFLDLAEEFEKQLTCKVDLVSRKGIKDRFFAEIKKDIVYV
jgi:predicted nucleotidyltransferase